MLKSEHGISYQMLCEKQVASSMNFRILSSLFSSSTFSSSTFSTTFHSLFPRPFLGCK